METRNKNKYSAASNSIGSDDAAAHRTPPPRPYPVVTACNSSDPNQIYSLNAQYPGAICLKTDAPSYCFNVQESENHIISYEGQDKGNGQFYFDASTKMLKANMTTGGSTCIISSGAGEQLTAGPCSSPGATGWAFDAANSQITFAGSAQNSGGCVANRCVEPSQVHRLNS